MLSLLNTKYERIMGKFYMREETEELRFGLRLWTCSVNYKLCVNNGK